MYKYDMSLKRLGLRESQKAFNIFFIPFTACDHPTASDEMRDWLQDNWFSWVNKPNYNPMECPRVQSIQKPSGVYKKGNR